MYEVQKLDPEPEQEVREENPHLSTLLHYFFNPCSCLWLRRLDLLSWYTSGFE